MRIVTRPDFDGVVCAVLLGHVLGKKKPVIWAEPNAVQNGLVEIKKGDVIANLAYNQNCALWFDHHISNRMDKPFKGAFSLAPSAARVVFDYYKGQFKRDFNELVDAADHIDAAQLSLDEVLNPGKYPYVSLDLTISSQEPGDEAYWNHLVTLLGTCTTAQVLADPQVQKRLQIVLERNRAYSGYLRDHSRLEGRVVVTDFRSFNKAPKGNRFLVFSLFPDAMVNVKIRFHETDRKLVIVSVGHSIFNKSCRVNLGKLCAAYSGGGHKGAGSCCFPAAEAEKNIAAILAVLLANKEEE